MKRAIIIMAKAPTAGKVKTRLQPFLPPEKCAELATAFLQDAETKAKSVCVNTILAYAPADKSDFLESITVAEHILIAQSGATLGARMSNAFNFAFSGKSDSVVLIGTDSPTFPAEFIKQAFEFLETNADLVLGKTADGGFYLIGLRGKNYPQLYENVNWSSMEVFEQTVKNAEQLKLLLQEIPAWYDVDTPTDFIKLRDEFFSDESAKQNAPQTFQWLQSNTNLFDSI